MFGILIRKTTFILFFFVASRLSAVGINLSGEALYWYTTETVDWALVLDPESNFQGSSFETVSFSWDPGFRVGLGFTNSCCWDTQFSYTYFKTKTTNRIDKDRIQSEFFGPKLSLVGFFQEAKLRMEIDYQMFEGELGYQLAFSECLHFRPFIGVQGGWIDQEIKSSWKKTVDLLNILIFPVTATEDLTNDFWGVGPKGGADGKWFFTECFCLVGNFSAAMMWGHWKITDEYQDSLISRISTRVSPRDFGALMVQGFLGLGFEMDYFSMSLGYEVQDWFNQYQVFDNGTGGHSGDLVFQGGSFKACLDF